MKKILISFFIATTLVSGLFFFSPRETEAISLGEVAGGGFSAVLFCSGVLNEIGGFLGGIVGGFLSQTVPVDDSKSNAKDGCLDNLAYITANLLIEEMSRETINWISGRNDDSGPKFVTNLGGFLGDVSDKAIGEFFQNELPLVCSPFRLQVQAELLRSFRRERFTQCTLSDVISNVNDFNAFVKGDFFQGGWDGWLSITRPENNPWGALLNARNSIEAKIAGRQKLELTQLEFGNGFISWRQCPDTATEYCPNGGLLNPDTSQCAASERVCYDKTLGAYGGDQYQTATPGSVIENQLNNVVGSGLGRLEAADEINEIISALLNRLISEVLTNPKGLLGFEPDKHAGSGCELNPDSPDCRGGTSISGTGGLCELYGICGGDGGGSEGDGFGGGTGNIPSGFCDILGIPKLECIATPQNPSPDPFEICDRYGITEAVCTDAFVEALAGGNGEETPSILACNDGIDNDADGLIDLKDPGCRNPNDKTENTDAELENPPSCSDGADNDGDGLTDYPADSGCLGAGDTSEKDAGQTDAPELDLSTAIIASNSPNPGNWKVTSNITSTSISVSEICINHSKAGQWPIASAVEGNPWIFAYIDGSWYGGTYEWLKSGQTCKALGVPDEIPNTAIALGQHIKNGPLAEWVPEKGEVVYLMVSTLAREKLRTIDERSNAVKVIWPY